MSRERKYRAWNTVDKVMIYDLNSLRTINGVLTADEDDALMEFTGLHDKNGRLIYEGDIVTDHNGKGVVKYSCKHAAFRVSYGDGTAKWFYDYILNGERESIEVISNVYENKDLL